MVHSPLNSTSTSSRGKTDKRHLGGVIPPTPENRLKFYRDQSFANTILHEASQQNVSVPPDQTDYDQWTLSAGMKEEISRTVEGIFGNKSTTWEITDYRICWYAQIHIRFLFSLFNDLPT